MPKRGELIRFDDLENVKLPEVEIETFDIQNDKKEFKEFLEKKSNED